jgi:hypothetical protein
MYWRILETILLAGSKVWCISGSRDFPNFQVVADAVKNAQSLRKLYILRGGESFPRDPSGMIALSNALREHTTLQAFTWVDWCFEGEEQAEAHPNPVLRALPACPHLRKVTIISKCASADDLKNLLRVRSVIDLCLILETMEQWLAVVGEVRLGRCLIKNLNLGMLQSLSSKKLLKLCKS